MKAISDTTLVSAIQEAKKPVVIKFEANWCQPCKAMAPIMRDIEAQFGDRVDFWSANVDHCMLITQRYQINSIPALVAIEIGIMTAKRLGAASKAEIIQWMEQSIPALRNER